MFCKKLSLIVMFNYQVSVIFFYLRRLVHPLRTHSTDHPLGEVLDFVQLAERYFQGAGEPSCSCRPQTNHTVTRIKEKNEVS